MKCLLISLFSFFLLIQSVAAQKIAEAEIVMEDGMTKKGYIEFRHELKKYPVLRYREDKAAPVQKIKPIQVKQFKVKDYFFRSARVAVESSSNQKTQLSDRKEPVYRVDNAFLLVVVEGPKSLYFYKDHEGKDHFLIKEDGEYRALINKKYADYFGPVIRVKENKSYVSQLAQYLKTDHWRVDFSAYEYNIERLRSLFQKYYQVNRLELEYVNQNWVSDVIGSE